MFFAFGARMMVEGTMHISIDELTISSMSLLVILFSCTIHYISEALVYSECTLAQGILWQEGCLQAVPLGIATD